jgi:hypothetical protein
MQATGGDRRFSVLAASGLAALVVATASAQEPDAAGPAVVPADARGAPTDFSLEETSGTTRTLTEARGRVIILFYEDREHTEDNVELKRELHQYIADNHLEEQVRVYAVADVHSIPGAIRDMARAVIRAIASEYGIQILLDWEGALLASPFSMTAGAANVVLFDTAGRVAWRFVGELGPADDTAFYRALRHLLRE